jgi:hypothetical protein
LAVDDRQSTGKDGERMRLIALIVGLVVVVSAVPAHADNDYFKDDSANQEVTFQVDRARTSRQRLLIGSLFAGAALCAGGGLYFHLDSRAKTNDVEAVDQHTGRIYTEEVADTRSQAFSSRRWAIAGYGVGGLLVVGAVVAFALTDPGKERITVGKDSPEPPAPVIPVSVLMVRGGAMVGGAWSF